MDNPLSASPELSPAPRKQRKTAWIWISAVLACLCLCVAIPVVAVIMDPTYLNLFTTGAPQVQITAGTYEGTIYTSPDGHFSCDFNIIMDPGMNPVLRANENTEKGTGTAFALNDFGMQYGVDYFHIASLNNSNNGLAEDLASPNPRRETLQAISDKILLPVWGPKATITHQEFLQDDILFAIIYAPETSDLISEQNGVTTRLDYQEGYYIFASSEWFYFVYAFVTPTNISEPLSPPAMQSRVDEFYQVCQFQP